MRLVFVTLRRYRRRNIHTYINCRRIVLCVYGCCISIAVTCPSPRMPTAVTQFIAPPLPSGVAMHDVVWFFCFRRRYLHGCACANPSTECSLHRHWRSVRCPLPGTERHLRICGTLSCQISRAGHLRASADCARPSQSLPGGDRTHKERSLKRIQSQVATVFRAGSPGLCGSRAVLSSVPIAARRAPINRV